MIDYKLDLNLPLFQNSLEYELNIFQGLIVGIW